MTLDARTLALVYILLSALLSILLLFAWAHNRRIRALAWWSAAFGMVPVGIGMANLGRTPPSLPVLLIANMMVAGAYAALYAGCRAFNDRPSRLPALLAGPALWAAAFPFLSESPGARLALLSLISSVYAAMAAWELWKHSGLRLTARRAAILLLLALAAFNGIRLTLGLSLRLIFWADAFASRWSGEMALFLAIYTPTLAFVLLAMAKERTELALRESEEHYRYSVELSPQIPWIADPQGNLLDVPPRWEALTGLPVKESRGTGWTQAMHPDDLPLIVGRWSHSLSTGKPFNAEFRVRLADGSYRWCRGRAAARRTASGTVIRWYGNIEDIHDRMLAQEQLRWAAYHDDLTGLPNRRRFQQRLQEAIDRTAEGSSMVGLLVIDLDNLKLVNDRFGHAAGDALLKEFAKRLRSLAGGPESIARLGGDEFALILPAVSGEAEALEAARTVLSRMQHPVPGDDAGLDCRGSIGIALAVDPGTKAETLQKHADLALYRAKASGRGAFRLFQPSMRDEAERTASALELAGMALAEDWIVPFYQPKVALGTNGRGGFEALLRWHHPRLGLQTPDTIWPAFDDTELGSAIGERMRRRVFRDMRRWLDAGLPLGRVAINISAAEFRHDDYAERILAELHQSGVPTHCLEVEVTETVFLGRHADNVERALRMLSEAGVTIALDDFGTGYASLTHLKRFPVDAIKIDRSFVRDIETDSGDAAIVRALLSLGQSLNIVVVAEGVETAAQAAFLEAHGCNLAQGHFFGRPMPAEHVPAAIAAGFDQRDALAGFQAPPT
ncbi:putative bifunctional diguanylate cyclase/phosphodiesterase [Microvirga mediterraneensis]|uniref:EAL domain-containing protein n=1 Tax=Microvirga mediterraneensis TaxID=2754695 RepID=A0A838BG78_9HYPH|nr:EAL domain-containing protein [Microvirga mediterraneensis]MBA1154578.1 EAL domain-containing protein [Microvirga mediterraneensis]